METMAHKSLFCLFPGFFSVYLFLLTYLICGQVVSGEPVPVPGAIQQWSVAEFTSFTPFQGQIPVVRQLVMILSRKRNKTKNICLKMGSNNAIVYPFLTSFPAFTKLCMVELTNYAPVSNPFIFQKPRVELGDKSKRAIFCRSKLMIDFWSTFHIQIVSILQVYSRWKRKMLLLL